MKRLLPLMLLASCVQPLPTVIKGETKTKKVTKVITKECTPETVEVVVYKDAVDINESFVGNYISEDSMSFIRIDQDSEGLLRLESADQVITILNTVSNTYGTLPLLTFSRAVATDNSLVFINKSFAYTNTSNDLEHDLTGVDITGSRRTDIIFTKNDAGLEVNIRIFEGNVGTNVNNVQLDRTINLIKY